MAARASTHNGRAGKNGAFSAKHNDRQFDSSKTDHIDPTLTPQNKNVRFGGDYGAATNEDHELAFYRDHFGESLERKNAGYKAKGKPGQIKTMEQYYRSVKSCPEETLYTIGKDIEPQLLWKIYREHQEWKAREFPQCQTLDAALHVDEPNAMPHIHERSIWIGHDAQGKEVVGQAKALAEMGVLPPDPEKKYGKFNNAKQTFTKECREHFIEICRAHNLEIVVEPLPPDKVGLELTEYKIQHAQEREAAATQQAVAAEEKLADLETQVEAQIELNTIQGKLIQDQKQEIESLKAELQPYKDLQASMDEIGSTGRTILPGVVAIKKKDLAEIQEQAKTYRVNRDEVEEVRERVIEVSRREQAVEQRSKSLDRREQGLDKIQQQTIDAYNRQLHLNHLLEQSERDGKAKDKQIAALTAQNRSLTAQLDQIKADLWSKINNLTDKLKGAYESLTNIVKGVGMLKYDREKDQDGKYIYGKYGISNLSKDQEKLIDGLAEYGAKWAREDGFTEMAEEMEKRVGISKGLKQIIEPNQVLKRSHSHDDLEL